MANRTDARPDACVQEIVSQPGWVGGNALAFFFSGGGDRSVVAYYAATGRPALVIHFEPPAADSAPAPAGTIPILSNHQVYLPITAVQYCN
ncbi:MAG: hypothetical protein H6645_07640 [Caldilineaceae bacterium]|nr:hypothetical protein [Caldilineaceae bacterium]